MSSSSDPSHGARSIDDALAEFLRFRESGKTFDRKQWLAQYPQWANELREFIASHDEMESFAGEMRRRRDSAVSGTPFGTEIRYVGEYELLGELGHGGMGIVYKARQASLDRIVALKMLLDNTRDRDRFRSEAEAAAALDHPNLVTIFEIGEHENWPYYTMRFVDGDDLREHVETGAMSPSEAGLLVSKLARAVQYAHDRGILHRDLKPGNVLIDKMGEPHITDFGLAKFVSDTSSMATRVGSVLGTPSYMAPEQAAGDSTQVTVASDVYGLGGVLYALLTGRAPFTGASGLATLRKVEREQPVSPRQIRANVPADLETICLKCLAKNPRDRYRSADALANDLERFAADRPIMARPVNVAEHAYRWCRRNPAISSLAALLLFALIGSAVGSLWMANRERRARDEVEQARSRVEAATEEAEETLVDSFVTNGWLARRRMHFAEALLWYATAADEAKTDRQRLVNNLRVQLRQPFIPKPIAAQRFPGGRVSIFEFHPSSRYLLVGDGAGMLYHWDLADQESWQRMPSSASITAAEWSRDGARLLLGTENGEIASIDLASGLRQTLGRLNGPIRHLALSASPAQWIIAASESEAQQFSLASDNSEAPEDERDSVWCPTTDAKIAYVTINQAGTRVAIQMDDNHVHLRKTDEQSGNASQALIAKLDHTFFPVADDRPRPPRPQFAPPDKLLVYDQPDVKTFDVNTGELISELSIGDSRTLTIDAAGKYLLNGDDRRARNWWLGDGDWSLGYHHRGLIVDAQFCPDGERVAVGGWDRRVRVWKVNSTLHGQHMPHLGRVARIRFSPCGNFIATAQLDGLVRVYRLPKTMKPYFQVDVPDGGSRGLMLDQGVMFTGDLTGESRIRQLRIVHPEDGQAIAAPIPLSGNLVSADSSSDGKQAFAIVDQSSSASPEATKLAEKPVDGPMHELVCCDLIRGEVVARIDLPQPCRKVVQYDERVVAITEAGMLLWFDHELNLLAESFADQPAVLSAVQRSSSGKTLAIARDKTVNILDVATGRTRGITIEHGTPVSSVAISPDDRYVASASRQGELQIRSIDSSGTNNRIALPDYVYSVHFSPDGSKIVAAAADGAARLIDVATGELIGRPMSHENDVFDAVFSKNGEFVYSIGDNGLFMTWDGNDGSLIHMRLLPYHKPPGTAFERRFWLEPAQNGHRVLVCGKNERSFVLDTQAYESGIEKIDTAKQRAIIELSASERIDGTTKVPLATSQWLEKWSQYLQQYGPPETELDDKPEVDLDATSDLGVR